MAALGQVALLGSQSAGALGSGLGPRQKELQELQRAYRFMEMHRRDYSEESQRLLRKQQGAIDALAKQNKELKSEIGLVTRRANKPMSEMQQDAINKLIDMSERYAKTIEFETENVATMEEQIAVMRQKAFLQRKTMGGVNASRENVHMIQKQIRILENRLDKALLKYNEGVAVNKELRDAIDDLRRERVVFESIYKKMERQLQERKQQMALMIESSNQSYEQRDAYQMELAALEQANRREEEEFGVQCAELGRMLEEELRLPSASPTKLAGSASTRSPSKQQQGEGAQTLLRTASAPLMGSEARVHSFEEAFRKIRNATGITDTDALVRSFIKNEDHNFSLFNYVSEQNGEVERLEEALQALRDEERRYSAESADVDSHKLLLRELESKLQAKEGAAERYEDRCKAQLKVVEGLKRGCHSIHRKLEQHAGGGEEESEGRRDSFVTESNMVHYLGDIEQRVNRLLVEYASVRERMYRPTVAEAASPGRASVALLGTGPKVPMGKDAVVVHPPKLDEFAAEEEEDEEDEARPLTRDELKSRTLLLLQRRGHAVAKPKQQVRQPRGSVLSAGKLAATSKRAYRAKERRTATGYPAPNPIVKERCSPQ